MITTQPTILTLADANQAGLKQSVTYRASWPRDRAELESILANLTASGIPAAIVIIQGTMERGTAEVRRKPVPKANRPLYQQTRTLGGSPKLQHTRDGHKIR
ncbi:hypothetical protein [Prosthecobacter sp.]|uniref:hypothetical protein n=1 Tax=Prosthecobacter sp. TaxID=1965333 RepID=UPI0037845B36